MQLPDNDKTKRFVNNLKKKANNRIVQKELPQIPGAIKRFEKLEKEVKKLRKQVNGQEVRIQKLTAEKKQREMRGENVRKT